MRRLFIWSLLAASLWGPLGADSARLEDLVRHSPFGGGPTAAGTGTAQCPLEFRGVAIDGAETLFSIHEVAAHTSVWLSLKEVDSEIKVRGYDNMTGLLTVEYRGRTLKLTLANAKLAASPPVRPALAGASPDIATTDVADGALLTPKPDQALVNLTETISRRRMERAAAAARSR